jgi:hypothetical protein
MKRVINGVVCTFEDPDALSQACVDIFATIADHGDPTGADEPQPEGEEDDDQDKTTD